jgi:DNA-binding protein H-NS
MNRNVSTRIAVAPVRPARPTALRSAPRFQPKKKSIVGRIVRWFVFLGIVGAVVASFFVKAPDGNTYADLYTIPASKGVYHWVKEKISPPEEEAETPKKEAAPSELDTKFDEAVAQREKAEAAKTPEAADEAVAVLEKELEAAGRRIDVVREIGLAASKPAPRKTRVGTAAAVEELAAQAAAQKKIAATLAKRKSELDVKAALAAVPPPPPPPPPPPAPAAPPVVSYDLKKLHAWPAQAAGTWVRWKKTAGETVSFEDHVLATLSDEAAVVRIETQPGNQTTAERVFVFGADKARVLREETLKVGDAEIPCRVVQSGSTLRWIPKEGPGADRVALKVQTGDQAVVVTELSEEEIPVKGEAKKCLKYTAGELTVWGRDDVPGFAVRVKTGFETAEAIDWAADLAARPASPKPAKAEERPDKALLAEAERLKVEGWVLLRDVVVAMKTPPEEQETLKTLFLKVDSATALLTKAREGFLSAKEKASDPASIDETISILGRVLGIADRYSESIKSRLK